MFICISSGYLKIIGTDPGPNIFIKEIYEVSMESREEISQSIRGWFRTATQVPFPGLNYSPALQSAGEETESLVDGHSQAGPMEPI